MSDSVIKPDMIKIEGRNYRLNSSNSVFSTYQEHDAYEHEEKLPDDFNDDEEESDDFEVIKIDDTRYLTYLHVAKEYICYLIGKKGVVKNRIQYESKTDIKFPNMNQDGDIAIYGPTVNSLKAARRKLNLIVTSSRMKQRNYTHFISIPMNDESIMHNFEAFKDQVLKDCKGQGLDESLFISKNKLHFTLGAMCLMDDEERMTASKLLIEAKDKIIMPLLGGNFSIKIKVKGISYMNDDPKKIDVLYACLDRNGSSDVIQKLANEIEDYFYKAGFVNKKTDCGDVKLHMTLINTRYRDASSDESTPNKYNKRESFDGSAILEKLNDYYFGEAELTHIHLSQMHTKGDNGYYQPTCIVSCNEDEKSD